MEAMTLTGGTYNAVTSDSRWTCGSAVVFTTNVSGGSASTHSFTLDAV
jgi:hypothetical protein